MLLFYFSHFTDMSQFKDVYFTTGTRGNPLLIMDNYTYYKFSTKRRTQIWYCSQRKTKHCKSRVKLNLENCSVNKILPCHTHEPRPIKSEQFILTKFDKLKDL